MHLSPIEKFRNSAALKSTKPGASKIFRPELPKRKEFRGAKGKADLSNHCCTPGWADAPFAIRSGRFASPKFKFTFATRGVNGAQLYARPARVLRAGISAGGVPRHLGRVVESIY